MDADRTVLITGGTGTFGNALLRRLLRTGSGEVHIFSRDEAKQHDMRINYESRRLRFYLGDVRRLESLDPALVGVDDLFHVAALKHVPSCEACPMEALLTNAVGTDNVLHAACAAHVQRMVVASTDKAVYPISTMGITKALMEKLMLAQAARAAASDCTVVLTRCGNLLASRGSVIPRFLEQIKAGRPLTVTDPQMTRFVMSIEDAVDLALFALEMGRPGDLFVRKSPAVTIETLAHALCQVFGVSRPMEVIGRRPGEKTHESLLTRSEIARAVDLGHYYCVPSAGEPTEPARVDSAAAPVWAADDYTSQNTYRLDVAETAELLLTLAEVREALENWRPLPARKATHRHSQRPREKVLP